LTAGIVQGGHRQTALRALPLALLVVLLALVSVGPSVASAAAPAYNMLGTWTTGYQPGSTREPANGKYEITAMNMATGTLSGTAETLGTHFTLEGVESGSEARITLKDEAIKYTAYDTLPLSVLANGHIGGTGTFNSTGFGLPGTGFWAELTSTTPAEEAAKKAKEEAEKEKRPTGTSIICNYEFATSQNTCVASVGDGGTPPSIAPTGTVTFTTTSGGFSSGAACSIAPTPSSPSVASCSLVYFTANSGLPSITATYSGDAHHAPSSGKTQFLGMGTEGTFEAPTGPSGQYPNELPLSTEVPVGGTTVEGTVQGPDPHPLPVPITLPGVSSALDAPSAADLRIVEALAGEVDVEAAQNPAKVSELDQSIEKLDARAVELTKSASPTEQAEGQKLLKDASETTEAVTKMLKLQGEYAKDALEGTRTAGLADKRVETLDAQAVQALEGPTPADQAKGQALLNEANQTLEALLKAAKQKGEVVKKVVGNASAAAAGPPRLARIKSGRVKALGYVTMRNVAAGKLKLKLHLNRAALSKLAGRRSSVTVDVRVDMILPSGLFKGGVPRAFVQRVTLKRAPKHKK
jgi:hypothetical protein